MGKRQKPGKRSHMRAKKPTVADVEYVVRAAPAPVDRDAPPKMKRLYRAVLGDAEAGFAAEVTRLETLVRSTDPRFLLAEMSIHHLFHPAGFDHELALPDPLIQFHLEWLQAFCLRFSLAEYDPAVPLDPAIAAEISERLKRIPALSTAVQFRRREEKFGRDPSGQTAGSWEQELVRTERLARRNWSYRSHLVQMVSSLCAPLDGWALSELGHRLSGIAPLLFRVEAETERRVNRQRRAMSAVLHRAKSAIGMSRRWQQSCLPGADRAIELENELRNGRLSAVEFVSEFNRAMEQEAPGLFSFSIVELEVLAEGRLSGRELASLMGSISFRFSDLRNVPPEFFTLGNPAWLKPFIALDETAFFCPLPGIGLSHCLDLVGALVQQRDTDLWGQTRADFLQARTHEVIAQAFPTATIYPNSSCEDPRLENDVAAILDDVALVLEAKAHQVDDGTWRGGPKGMRGAVEELVVEPSAQGQRFAAYVLETRGPRPLKNDVAGDFVIDSTSIRSAVRANVVLDPFPIVRLATRNLREAKLLRDDEPDPAPTYLLADLVAAMVLLPDELQRLHYLARRQVIQNRCWYQADEHDLLALYVDTGFNLPELEEMTGPFSFWGLARKHVDPYLEEAFAGKGRRPRPERRLQPGWRRILKKLEADRPPDWVTIGMCLLDASAEAQHRMLTLTMGAARNEAGISEKASVASWSIEVGLSFWRSIIVGLVTRGLAPEDWAQVASAVVDDRRLNAETPCIVLHFEVTANRKVPVAYLYRPTKGAIAA